MVSASAGISAGRLVGMPQFRLRVRLRDGPTVVRFVVGERRIVAARPLLDRLREDAGQANDLMTSIERLLRWAEMGRELPVVLLLYRGATLYAAVMLACRRWRGIPIGLTKAGNLAGQGSVIARQEDRRPALETAARILLRHRLAHTVVFSTLLPPADPGLPEIAATAVPVPGVNGHWQFREARVRVSLEGGWEAVMGRLSYKMRRNLRYYRRRAEADLGWAYRSDLSPAERQVAVATLHRSGPYPVHEVRAAQIEAALDLTPGRFAMGLQSPAGEWISYITGWRSPEATFIEWQLNSDAHRGASVSTVMRTYLMDFEIGQGRPAVVFVGLTTPFWARACELQLCADLIATSNGATGRVVRALTARLSPHGRVAALLARPTSPPAVGGED